MQHDDPTQKPSRIQEMHEVVYSKSRNLPRVIKLCSSMSLFVCTSMLHISVYNWEEYFFPRMYSTPVDIYSDILQLVENVTTTVTAHLLWYPTQHTQCANPCIVSITSKDFSCMTLRTAVDQLLYTFLTTDTNVLLIMFCIFPVKFLSCWLYTQLLQTRYYLSHHPFKEALIRTVQCLPNLVKV